jgi:hypothetical protein
MRFQAFTAMRIKLAVFWDVALCSVADIYLLMMEAVSSPETPLNIYHTTRRNIPEDSHLKTDLRTNFHVTQ